MLDLAGLAAFSLRNMSLRKSSRATRPPVTLKDFHLETDPEASSQARAIREELDHVESLLESLTPEAGRKSAASDSKPRGLTPEVKDDLSSDVLGLQNENLKLELELTRAKIELARTQSEVKQNTQSNMAASASAHSNTQQQGRSAVQRSTIPSLKTLQTDPAGSQGFRRFTRGTNPSRTFRRIGGSSTATAGTRNLSQR